MPSLLYELPRELDFLPDAALAVARMMNERAPYLPGELLEQPLDEARVRAIAKKHDVVSRMSGETPAVLFELLARFSHRECLHSLDLLVRTWDPHEEIGAELIADAIQPLFAEAWDRTTAVDSKKILAIVAQHFSRHFSQEISDLSVEIAALELRMAAEYIEASRKKLNRELASNQKKGREPTFEKHPLLVRLGPRWMPSLVKLALEAPAGGVAAVLCTTENAELFRSLNRNLWGIRETYGWDFAGRFSCPELRAVVSCAKSIR